MTNIKLDNTDSHKIRVVVDTNLWISFLIGHQLASLLDMLSDARFEIVTTERLTEEIRMVVDRPKMSKYLNPEKVSSLFEWMNTYMTSVEIGDIPNRCRDPKDDYLLELAVQAKAIYLVSGDKDLLDYGMIGDCRIMTVSQFETEIYQLMIG